MTEQSRETDEVFSSIGDTLRGALFVAIELGVLVAARRAARAEQIRAESDATARVDAQRLRDQRAGAMPIMRQPWNDRWWKRASPQRIADSWQVVQSWAANDDPYAQTTLQYMRQQIEERYGISIPDTPTEDFSLADILGAGPGTARAEPDPGDVQRAGTSYRYEITHTDAGVIADGGTGIVHVPFDDARPIETIAAETLLQHNRKDPHSDYVISIQDSQAEGAQPFRLSLKGADVVMNTHARILNGEQDTSPEKLREVLRVEDQRLRQELWNVDPDMLQDRQALAERRRATGMEVPAVPEPPADAAARAADIRERRNQIGLRLDAVEAEIRGEDGFRVFQAAALRAALDDGWWQGASTAEVTHLFGWAQSWSDGEAKSGVLATLRDGIRNHYGVSVDDHAGQDEVDNKVYEGQAKARGERVVDYTIETTLISGERAELVDGRVAVPNDEPSHETARGVLEDWARTLNNASNQRLQVTMTDRETGRETSHTAASLAADHAKSVEAQGLRSEGFSEESAATRSRESGDRLHEADERGDARAGDEFADYLHTVTEQERDAAVALDSVADREAAEAVSVASEGWPMNPTQRLTHSSGRSRSGQPAPGRPRPRTPARPPEIQR